MSTQETEFNLDEFLGSFDFDETEKATAKSLFEKDTRKKELKDRGLRQSDYDRKMDKAKADLKKQQDDLEADIETKQAEILEEKQKLSSYKTKIEKDAAQERIRAMVADVKIKKASELYGIDIDAVEVPEAEELAKELKAKESEGDKPEKSSGVTMEDVLKTGEYLLDVNAELADIEETFKELFPDKKFPRKEFLAEARKNAAHRDPNKRKFMPQTAEEMFKFSEVRDTKRVKEIEDKAEAKWKKKYEEDLTQELSKQGLRKSDDETPRSTFWKNKADKPTTRTREDRVSAVIGARNKAA